MRTSRLSALIPEKSCFLGGCGQMNFTSTSLSNLPKQQQQLRFNTRSQESQQSSIQSNFDLENKTKVGAFSDPGLILSECSFVGLDISPLFVFQFLIFR